MVIVRIQWVLWGSAYRGAEQASSKLVHVEKSSCSSEGARHLSWYPSPVVFLPLACDEAQRLAHQISIRYCLASELVQHPLAAHVLR
jgi:hypothetical protein